MRRILFASLFFLFLFACHQTNDLDEANQKLPNSEYKMHLNALISLSQNDQIDIQANPLYETIQQPLQAELSATTLMDYYYECEKAKLNSEINPNAFHIFSTAQEAILLRLADLNDIASAKSLVEIYADDSLAFDASQRLTLGEALVQCGDEVVPHLTKVRKAKPLISERVLECIKTGRAFL